MFRARNATPAAFLAAAIAVTASACSSFVANVRAQNDPLQAMSGPAIAQMAITDTQAAPGVRISGTMKNYGQAMTIDLQLASGKNCAGTMSQSQTGSFKLVYIGSDAWVMPGKKFWQAQGSKDAALLPQVESKYLTVKAGEGSLGSLVTICSLNTLIGSTTGSGKNSDFGAVTRTTYQGQQAVKIADTIDNGYVYVTDTASPRLLSLTPSGKQGGGLTFTYSAKPPAITAPPATEVVDGSKYGF